ncbi:hypothetical protein E4U42_001672 [Claviceps africana]|uniref:Uncharacterized protein n=1 Tax=Claviceps africana TaxID=83212 RepID=A0A8K0NK04_9HYPO|nr:hypothetical protein E4U42_001672 [Claviceps africana]
MALLRTCTSVFGLADIDQPDTIHCADVHLALTQHFAIWAQVEAALFAFAFLHIPTSSLVRSRPPLSSSDPSLRHSQISTSAPCYSYLTNPSSNITSNPIQSRLNLDDSSQPNTVRFINIFSLPPSESGLPRPAFITPTLLPLSSGKWSSARRLHASLQELKSSESGLAGW